MQKAIFVSILTLTLLPTLCFGQWNSQGGVNGQTFGDALGSFNSIATDSAGNTMAVGSAFNSQVGQEFGYAKVFDRIGLQWIQRGQTINGFSFFRGTGRAVDLSADGNTLVVSSVLAFNSVNLGSGVVRVFDWDGTAWIQRGNNIDGEGGGDEFGTDVSITPDGNFLAVGGWKNTTLPGAGFAQGHVRVYQWNGLSWIQMGQDLDGTVNEEEFGRVIDISANGTIVAVGSRSFSTVDSINIGSVKTFSWNGTQWIQFGNSLLGINANDNFGSSVSLSHDGLTMAAGNRKNNGGASSVQVFTINNNIWVPKGSSIVGVANDLGGALCSLNSDGSIVGVGFQWANFVNGVARVLQWNGSNWIQVGNDLIPNNGSILAFGSEICLNASGSNVLIGSSGDDAVDFNSGRVYMFQNDALVTSILEYSDNQLEIFPNPTSNYVQIKSNHIIDSYSLFSMDGKIVKSEKFLNLNQITIDMTGLNSGIFLLKMNANGHIISNRIIKE